MGVSDEPEIACEIKPSAIIKEIITFAQLPSDSSQLKWEATVG